jgi:MoaA/NifB/PqqE/SkfB family radical SAM enzyme
MEPYHANKASLHFKQLYELQNGKQPYPVHVQLIISDYCNQDCSFCAYRMSGYNSNELFKIIDQNGNTNNNPKRMIPWNKLKEIVEDCKNMQVKAIQITGGGEPTLHPNFDQLCELILNYKIDLSVVTNGLLLNKKRAKILSDAIWTRISVDAATPETYSLIRRVPAKEFDIVEKNIKFLTSVQEKKCCVGIGFVVVKENYQEIFAACEKFKSWGVDNVRLSAVFQNDNENFYEGIYESILENIQSTQKLQDQNFKIYNNFNSRYSDLKQRSPNYTKCGYMNFTTYIGGDQNVYTCCVNSYNLRGKIGSIKDISFKNLWDSEIKQQMFDNFNAKSCPRCMFNDKNLAIAKLLESPQGHDNFV